jgi:hypothetical protein
MSLHVKCLINGAYRLATTTFVEIHATHNKKKSSKFSKKITHVDDIITTRNPKVVECLGYSAKRIKHSALYSLSVALDDNHSGTEDLVKRKRPGVRHQEFGEASPSVLYKLYKLSLSVSASALG